MKHNFDDSVVGGGHAGCEAAHAAVRMGVSVAASGMVIVPYRASTAGLLTEWTGSNRATRLHPHVEGGGSIHFTNGGMGQPMVSAMARRSG